MKICIIGTGYVGLSTAAVLADLGHHITCLDVNKEKIRSLQSGNVPFFEPNLEELIQANEEQLIFTLDAKQAITSANVIFVTVGTPSLPDGSANLTYLYDVLDTVSQFITSYKTIVIKSTVPIGTTEQCSERLLDNGVKVELFSIVSNPEFLREGSAVYDMQKPDRIVVGVQNNDKLSLHVMKSIYEKIEAPYVVTSLNGAEMIKYASNSFLATKISFINEIAKICDQYDVDVTEVSRGIGIDHRIGPYFLQAGIGYGGSCFPKDVRALEYCAKQKRVIPTLLSAVQQINATQVLYFIEKVEQHVPEGSQITILGGAFKPNTDDIRYSPAITIIRALEQKGYKVRMADPKAHLPKELKRVQQYDDPYEAIEGADGVIIATEWDEYKQLDFAKVSERMKGNVIFDGRNCLDRNTVTANGLTYIGVGRS
ncbi:UDP-glucose 6-dehydrogenase [Bacillus solimangrovi]|uniref:UDP-glucose 6-dehydrogenase n=1 Tax=Bacillus solimangrovi TaxID=1305675 RepID=A0A1E5LG42_9BACI|nr:UDP-glucose/GDP-mannose dehydrogenase family protein [Bacillus solimangrovi]OEH93042.1 UDP-glucose 6-dehydrogenase [Bacillus solimangrovi]